MSTASAGSRPAAPPLLAVPLFVGAPKTVTTSGGGVNVTTISAGWSSFWAVVTGIPGLSTTMGTGTGNVVEYGYGTITASGRGTLVLVTPVKIISNITGPIAAFGWLKLTYAPEPGTLLLLGLGIVALGALGHRRL